MKKIDGSNIKSCDTVLEFYLLTSKLKELIRSGWKNWNVKRERLESVAEHVYGTAMLAIAMNSEFDYDIDIKKVVLMIAVHEMEEIEIGDIVPFEGITREEKMNAGHKAICSILDPLVDGKYYIELIEEFDARETINAKFAYQCDKLEADLTAFRYDMDCKSPYSMADSLLYGNNELQKFVSNGAKNMSEFFYYYDRSKYDDNFCAVLDRMFGRINFA